MSSHSSSHSYDRASRSGARPSYESSGISNASAWLLRSFLMLLVLALPWYYGCANWQSQHYLFGMSTVFAALIAVHCVISTLCKSGDCRVPWVSWVFFGFAVFAYAQSLPVFSWQGTNMDPPSVLLQKWALGIAPAPVGFDSPFLKKTSNENASAGLPCDLTNFAPSEQKLALSVEPIHTKGALTSLILCGLLVWAGRMVFSNPNKQVWLFGTLTIVGIAIACFGILGAVSYEKENFLGLKTGSSYATFVSKNSAGGFLNICIAGCLGLLGWTLLNTQRKSSDVRYRFPDSSVVMKFRGFIEDFLADLNTPQIAAMLCLITIVASLLISLCRGAAVSGLAGIITAALIANLRSTGRGGWITTVAVTIATAACLIVFQMDDHAYARIESLSEIDLGEELRHGRMYIWSIAWQAMLYYGWFGSGLGTFHFAYIPFQSPSRIGWFYHAESLYAQCGVEMGFIGLVALVLTLFLLVSKMQKPVPAGNWKFAFPSKLAGCYLLFSQSIHSLVDFAIILPALFVPGCLLLGSVEGSLALAAIEPTSKRNSGKSTRTSVEQVSTKPHSFLGNGVLGLIVSISAGIALYLSLNSIRSLSLSESMVARSKAEGSKQLIDQISDYRKFRQVSNGVTGSISEIAKLWTMDAKSLSDNPNAMREMADGMIYDYRLNQLTTKTPEGSIEEAWGYTHPIAIQVVLAFEKEGPNRDRIIEAIGGKEALNQLNLAANWYAKGHAKSPMDCQLAWGRCISNVKCGPQKMAVILPACLQLASHNSQLLLMSSVLFQAQLDREQQDVIRRQAIKTDPLSSISVAQLMVNEYKDGEILLDVFPMQIDVLERTANQVFSKEKFPKTHRLFWERIQRLILESPKNTPRRGLALANASNALGDLKGEIEYLKGAIEVDRPPNPTLICRLVRLLIESGDMTEADVYLKKAKKVDPSHTEVRSLEERILKL